MKKLIVCFLFLCLQSEALLFSGDNSSEESLFRFKRGIIKNKLADLKDKREDRKDDAAKDKVDAIMNKFMAGGEKPADEELVSH